MNCQDTTTGLPRCPGHRASAALMVVVAIGLSVIGGCSWNRPETATPGSFTESPTSTTFPNNSADEFVAPVSDQEAPPYSVRPVSYDAETGRVAFASDKTMPPVPPPDYEEVETPADQSTPQPKQDEFVIDLATALRLGGGGALQVELARERTYEAQVAWSQSRFAILPSLRFGVGWTRHDGRIQGTPGPVIDAERNSLFVGGGAGLGEAPLTGGAGGPARLMVNLSLADAHFEPLAQRQLFDAAAAAESSQTNDTLRDIAVAYANLLETRSQLANNRVGLGAANDLVQLTTDFAEAGEGAEAEVYRAKTEQAYWYRSVEDARRRVIGATADLARILRLDPDVNLVPAEEQLAPVAMVDERMSLDNLIGTGLAARPELAQHQALVEERMVRLRQECLRPWLPYIQLGASAGSFGGGRDAALQNQGGRSDVDALAVWELKNLGIGNYLLKRRRDSQLLQAEIKVEFLQDQIIAEIIKAAADVASYRRQLAAARDGVESAKVSYEMNLDRVRDAVGLPLELVQAIRAQTDSQNAYTRAISDYNRAQYRLMHALGQPSELLARSP